MKRLLLISIVLLVLSPLTASAGIIRYAARGTRFVAVNTAKGFVAVSKVSPYDIGKATVKGVKVAGKAVGKVIY